MGPVDTGTNTSWPSSIVGMGLDSCDSVDCVGTDGTDSVEVEESLALAEWLVLLSVLVEPVDTGAEVDVGAAVLGSKVGSGGALIVALGDIGAGIVSVAAGTRTDGTNVAAGVVAGLSGLPDIKPGSSRSRSEAGSFKLLNRSDNPKGSSLGFGVGFCNW